MSDEKIPIPEGWLDYQFKGGAPIDPEEAVPWGGKPQPAGPVIAPVPKPAGLGGMVRAGLSMAAPQAGGGAIGPIAPGIGATAPGGPQGTGEVSASDVWVGTLNNMGGQAGAMFQDEWRPEDEVERIADAPPSPLLDEDHQPSLAAGWPVPIAFQVAGSSIGKAESVDAPENLYDKLLEAWEEADRLRAELARLRRERDALADELRALLHLISRLTTSVAEAVESGGMVDMVLGSNAQRKLDTANRTWDAKKKKLDELRKRVREAENQLEDADDRAEVLFKAHVGRIPKMEIPPRGSR